MAKSLAEYFEQKKKEHSELVAQHKKGHALLDDRIAEKVVALKRSIEDRQRKQGLRETTEKEGLDTTDIAQKLALLDRGIQEAENEIAALKKSQEQLPEPPWDRSSRLDLLQEALENLDCTEAIEVDDIRGCMEFLSVGTCHVKRGRFDREDQLSHGTIGIALDGVGRPIECSLGLGLGDSLSVKIEPSNSHFFRQYFPREFAWIEPLLRDKEGDAEVHEGPTRESRLLAFIDRSSGELVLSSTTLHFQVVRGPDKFFIGGHGRRETETLDMQEDFSALAASLEERLKKALAAEGKSLDLNREYPEKSIMAHLRDHLLQLTTPKPRFAPSDDHLKSGDVYKAIKADWDAFTEAPWSAAICGSLALLKHALENGERPRFWCEGFKGGYGFRLRTRDHDWVKGRLFIADSDAVANAASQVVVHETDKLPLDWIEYESKKSVAVASIGRLYLLAFRADD